MVIDIIFYALLGGSIILCAIGAVYRYNWDMLRSFGNGEDEENFSDTLRYLSKKSIFSITVGVLLIIAAGIVYLIFRN